MASKISLDNINIKNHQGNFLDPIQLQITFSNLAPLSHPIEWKIVYFGSAQNEDCDQILQQFEIPLVDQAQTMKFQLSCQPPDFIKVPRQELLCVTAMILIVSYKNQQFIRVGYYVHYQYCGEESPENIFTLPPSDIVKMTKRTILFDKPRVTKFNIKWDDQPLTTPNTSTEYKITTIDQKLLQEESQEKPVHYQKQSTVQEKSERSNNFSDNADHPRPGAIECQ